MVDLTQGLTTIGEILIRLLIRRAVKIPVFSIICRIVSDQKTAPLSL